MNHFTVFINFINTTKKNGFVKNAKKTSNKLAKSIVLDVIKIRRRKYVKIANTGYKRGIWSNMKHYIDIIQQ